MSYVGEIADLFRSRCGDTAILCPMDYVIIAEWEKQGIPIALVTSAIDEAFGRIQGGDPRIDSVGYFQDIVKQNFREWLATGAAKGLTT